MNDKNYDKAQPAAVEPVTYLTRRIAELSDSDRDLLYSRLNSLEAGRRGESNGRTMGLAETSPATPAGELTLDNVEHAFGYQQWDGDQSERGAQVRDALVAAAKVLLRLVPRSPRRTKALNHLVDARMDANAAISFRGQF